MRTLRALVAFLLTAAVAALLAVWLAVPQVDMGRLRGQLVTLASERLGRAVGIEGKMSLSLLPQPMLVAANVNLPSGTEGVRLTVRELRVHIAVGPLLAGRVVAHDVVLQGADLVVPWPVDPIALLRHAPHGHAGFSAEVQDGRVQIGGAAITGITATLRTDADTGTWRVDGDGSFAGQPWHLAAALTRPGRDGSAAITAAVDGGEAMQGLGGKLSGQIAGDGNLAGHVAAWGPKLAQVLPGPAVPFRAEGRLTVADGLAAADNLSMDIGGARVRGAVSLRVTPEARLDLALAASRLDLDAWLPALARRAAFAVPTGLDLSAEAATLAGGTLRTLRCAAEFGAAGSEITDASAVLPGDAVLRLTGRMQPAAGGAHFAGGVAVQAPALRTTLAWLQTAGFAPRAALPEGVLRTATLAGRVNAQAGQIAVSDLSGSIDEGRITGSLTLRNAGRLAIGAGLTVDRLALDPWLPAAAPSLAALPADFAGFDADLRLVAKQATLRGATLAPLTLDAAAEAGRLTLRRLDAEVDGVRFSASAGLAPGGVLSEGRLDVQASQARPLAALLPARLAFLARSAPALWRAAATAQVLGSGSPDSLALKLTADLGDLRLEAQPTLDLAHDTWTANVALRHPGAPKLLQSLGFEHAPDWLGEGSLGVLAKLSGASGRVAADTLDVSAGALHATGTLLLDRGADMPMLSGHLDAETLPLPDLDARSDTPLPLTGLRGWDAGVHITAGRVVANGMPVLTGATAQATLHGGALRFEGVTGQLAGGTVRGTLALDTSGEGAPALTIQFDVAGATVSQPVLDLPLDIASGTLDAHVALSATGFAPQAMLATLGGDVAIRASHGRLAGVSLEKAVPDASGLLPDAAVAAALTGGSTPFDGFAAVAHAERGVLAISAAGVQAPAGTAKLTGQIDLPDRSLDLDLVFQPRASESAPAPPSLGLRLAGPIATPTRTPDLAALIRWRASRAAVDPP